MKHSGPILFDIDRTTFNTGKFIQQTTESLINAIGVLPEEFHEVEKAYLKTLPPTAIGFNPQEFTFHLSQKFTVDQKTLIDVFLNNVSYYKKSLYIDTIDVLEALQKSNKLGVYSEGIHDFQMLKLTHSGMMPYLDPSFLYISEAKLVPEVLETIPQNALIVDDKERVVEKLTEQGFHAIWINRKSTEKHSSAATIHKLSDVLQ